MLLKTLANQSRELPNVNFYLSQTSPKFSLKPWETFRSYEKYEDIEILIRLRHICKDNAGQNFWQQFTKSSKSRQEQKTWISVLA